MCARNSIVLKFKTKWHRFYFHINVWTRSFFFLFTFAVSFRCSAINDHTFARFYQLYDSNLLKHLPVFPKWIFKNK